MLTITFITDATREGPVHYPMVFDFDTDSVLMQNIYGDTLLVFDPHCKVFRDKDQKQLIGQIESYGGIFRFLPTDAKIEGFELQETSLKDTRQGNKYIDFEVMLAAHLLGSGKYNLNITDIQKPNA